MLSLDANSSAHPGAAEQKLDHADSTAAKCWREIELLGHGIVVGGVEDGVTQISSHPIEFGASLVGAAALGMAMKGPACVKVPALGLSVLGGVGFGLHAYDCIRTAAPAFGNAWTSGNGMDKNFAIADRSVGSLAFDAAVMVVAGKATGKFAERMPRTTEGFQRVFSARFDGLADSIANSIGIGRGPEFAYATGSGGGRSYGGFEVVMPESPRAVTQGEDLSGEIGRPMMMAASGTGGGSNEYHWKTWKEGGATIHEFDNVMKPGRTANTITHADKVQTTLGQSGNIEVRFTDGQSRVMALGRNISKAKIIEHPGGTKEFRLNGSSAADLIVKTDNHLVSARTARGIEHHFDAGNMPLEHSLGGRSLILNSGHVDVSFPDGQLRSLDMKQYVSRVHLTETTNGINELRFDGRSDPDLITNTNAHFMTARLPDSTKVHLFDITSTPFQTSDGLQASFSRDGQITIKAPGGGARVQSIESTIDQIMVLEAKDGTKTFITYGSRNNPASRNDLALTVPPLSNRTYWYTAPRPAPRPVPRPVPRPMPETAGPIGSLPGKYSFGSPPGFEEPEPDRYPFWRLNFPGSLGRGFMDTIAGIDHRAMPGSDMTRLTDLGIAKQEHNWVVEDYLAGLDRRK